MESGLSLGQYKVDAKSNEISAISELLKLLELSGSFVTIDAMGCQKKIAAAILKKDADYLVAVKDIHKTLYGKVTRTFDQYWQDNSKDTILTDGQWQAVRSLKKKLSVLQRRWILATTSL